MAEEVLKPPDSRWIIVDLPARLPKTYLRLSTLDLSQGGFCGGFAGKRRKVWPHVRFELIFGAKPI